MSEPKAIDFLEAEICKYVDEMYDMNKLIKGIDADLITNEKLPDDENMRQLLIKTVESYEILCKNLKITLESYFDEESKNNLPTNFNYRRLYKRITA